jgi:branched-chain amino acid transport system substrate-binding protein
MQTVLGMTSIAQLYDQTQNSQAAEAQAIKADASTLGVKVLDYEAYNAGDTDFRPQLTKIKADNPDWLMVDAAAPEAATIMNQASELGLTSKIYISEAANLFPSVWDATQGKVKGTYTATPGVVSGATPQDPDAVSLFKAKYGVEPSIYGTWGWDAAAAAVDAIKRACTGTDRQKVAAALANTKNFPMAITGNINWQNPPSGDNQTPTVVVVKVTASGVGQPIQ